ncbi:MAG: VOC family protein [Candidatus Bathyarchaeia archaeon]
MILSMMAKFELDHVAVVVKHLDKFVEKYWNILGVGPWNIFFLVPPAHKETYVKGKKVEYSLKVGIARLGNLSYELIEPLEGSNVLTDFLETKGEGLHHVAWRCDSLEDVKRYLEAFKKIDVEILQCGRFHDSCYYYFDTERLLGTVCEILYEPSSIKPNEVYPSGSG